MAATYSFLVIKYPKAETADAALAELKQLSNQGVLKLRDAVGVTKTEKGKIKLHQTKDDSTGKGFIKGGMIGILFAALFGPVGWIAMGAAAGGLFASFDRGIKNKLLKELGGEMKPSESAVAILIEQADWPTAVERMKAHHFEGQLVISEIVPDDIAEVEKLLADPKTVASVPEEIEIPVPVETTPVGAVAIAKVAAAPTPAMPVEQMRIVEVEGIGSAYAERLAAAKVKTTADLLVIGATPDGREGLAQTSGISGKLILDWVNKVDLMRIPGVGPQYSDLLQAAGVDSPTELAHRDPANLEETFQSVVAERPGIVRRIPSETEIVGWIGEADKLEAVVTH